MRVSLPLLFLVVPVAAFTYACEDDGGGGATGSFDAGTGQFEAGAPFDAGPVSDAAPPNEAAATGLVVNTKQLGKPIANVTVLFHDASGAVTGQTKSDASGVAKADKAPPMITVVADDTVRGGKSLLTYLGVVDGDVLNVEVPATPGNQTPVGTYNVSFTGALPNATGIDVVLNGGCSASGAGNATTVDLPVFEPCKRANNVLLAAGTDPTGYPAQIAFKKGEAAPPLNGNQAVTLPQWVTPQTVTVTAANAPPAAFLSSAFSAIADGAPFVIGQKKGALTDGGDVYAYAAGFPDAVSALVRAQQGNATQLLVKRSAVAATMPFDLATALPLVTAVDAAGTTRPDITVTAVPAAGLATTDGGMIALYWTTGTTNVQTNTWSFVVPPGTATVKVPALPTELADLAPPATATKAAGYFESDLVPGYTQFKQSILPVSGPPPAFDDRATLPTNGTARVTLWNNFDFAID